MTSLIPDNLLECGTYFSAGILEIRVRKNVLLFHKLVSAKFIIIKGPSPFQGIQGDHPCLRRYNSELLSNLSFKEIVESFK